MQKRNFRSAAAATTLRGNVLAGMALTAAAILSVRPAVSQACACGCNVFDVATSSLMPTEAGGTAYLEYDFMDQNKNWSGSSHAPAADNEDKEIRTRFFTVGAQVMFDRAWGMRVSAPYWTRLFKTVDPDSGATVRSDHSAFGDMRVKGMYTGWSPDMSSGCSFGLKLPTGDSTYSEFDRDTEIGTGSTDGLLGAFRRGHLAGSWSWFANGELDLPFLFRGDYRPGSEADAAVGGYGSGWRVGNLKIAPVLQAVGALRLRDGGMAASPDDSGYERVLLSPGVELAMGPWRVYGDIGFPVYEHVRGNQLVASELFTLMLGCTF